MGKFIKGLEVQPKTPSAAIWHASSLAAPWNPKSSSTTLPGRLRRFRNPGHCQRGACQISRTRDFPAGPLGLVPFDIEVLIKKVLFNLQDEIQVEVAIGEIDITPQMSRDVSCEQFLNKCLGYARKHKFNKKAEKLVLSHGKDCLHCRKRLIQVLEEKLRMQVTEDREAAE